MKNLDLPIILYIIIKLDNQAFQWCKKIYTKSIESWLDNNLNRVNW